MLNDPIWIVAIGLAIAQVIVTLRWYEPPTSPSGDVPEPFLEAAIFSVVFAGLFLLLSYLISRVIDFAPPWSAYGVLLLSAICVVAVVGLLSGRMAADRDPATRWLAIMFSTAVAIAIPVLVFIE